MAVEAAGKAQPTKEYAKNFELSVVARGLSDLVGGGCWLVWWSMVSDWWLVVGDGHAYFQKRHGEGKWIKKLYMSRQMPPQTHHHNNFK